MRIRSDGGWKDILMLVLSLLMFVLILLLPLTCASGKVQEAALLEACEMGQVIRMHILADSNSPRDQAVKLLVRDAIFSRYGKLLQAAREDGFDKLMEVIQICLPAIEKTAAETAARYGFAKEVHAEAGLMQLNEKKCGSTLLPKGEYCALVITLGSGKGENWWCVLYPRLCLSLSEQSGFPSAETFRWNAADILKRWLLAGN